MPDTKPERSPEDLVTILPSHGIHPVGNGVGQIVSRMDGRPFYYVTTPPGEGLPILVHEDNLADGPSLDLVGGKIDGETGVKPVETTPTDNPL